MNEQEAENPYASPNVDEIVEVLPDSEEETNREFRLRVGKIVGDSPLSLPEVCLYCADDIVDDYSRRMCAKFHRLRLLEALPPLSFRVYYSICSNCVINADLWRRRRDKALYFVIGSGGGAVVLLILFGRLGMLDAGFSLVALLGMVAVGFFFRMAYCESCVPKPPELESYEEQTMKIVGHGWNFIQRFR
ncbi:hypothetical protein [Blastopirellula retiformator]|uniref:Uncharacterized protein n=1 Tax=Blastopirellula retiformator TaxID=2527970 RepID=A0A5C5VL62_9BACT|nr:hypothetical protein [Blastopirellula retiformator]TWT38737.1 hypothetical protein Enr8_04310 [Blastopirellula retiformator]